MNNQLRPEILNVNSDDSVFFPFSTRTSKCSGSCNNISDLYEKLCVPHVVRMYRIHEKRHIE